MKNVLHRLDGSARQLPEMLPLETAPHILGLNPDQFRAIMQTEKLLSYRIRIGKQFKWFVLPTNLQFMPSEVQCAYTTDYPKHKKIYSCFVDCRQV